MIEATARENYDNPALSTGLTVGGIFADFEEQMLVNRKAIFQTAIKAADFKQAVYSDLVAFNNANAAAAKKALEEASEFARKEIERAYSAGISKVDANVEEYKKLGYEARTVSDEGARVLLAINVATTLANLAKAVSIGRQSANQQLLQITSLVDVNATDLSREIDDKQRIFLQKGVAGSYNKNGIATGLSSVAELQMREDSQKTLLAAQGERSVQYGLYLIQISAHPSSCPLCLPWQAKVLINDETGGKPDGKHELLSTAKRAGLFHYNCRHTYIDFIPGYSRENIFDFDRASDKQTTERYAIEQEQRYNERAIREWKRIEKGSMTERDRLQARRKVQEWQLRQRQLQKLAEDKRIPFYRQYQREAIGGATKPTVSPYNTPVGAPLHYKPNVLTRVTDNDTMPVTGIDKLDEAPILPVESRTIDKCAKTTNPNFTTGKTEYKQNCQRCVAAYEARRRGFDVQASEALIGKEDGLMSAYGPEGWTAVYTGGQNELIWVGGNTPLQAQKNITDRMAEYGDGSRAIVCIAWQEEEDQGHVFIAEQADGVTQFIDPQSGSKNCSYYFERGMIKPNQTFILRVDNKEFTNLLDKCIKIGDKNDNN